MERFLKDFDVDPSEEARTRWRSAVTIVKNRRRRFRNITDLGKRAKAEKNKREIQVLD
ncbi:hypothetical protein I3760_09G039600 [Carya illinoinensis]|nr:hypothetical protein I3760_09G039600 [Carya illinoinensis]